MYLLDTNIFLEVLLEQERSEEAALLLNQRTADLYVSNFSLHSIGVILFRQGLHAIFLHMLQDLLLRGGVHVATLDAELLPAVTQVALRFRLDFDDAYQYLVAERLGLTIVSFDRDFDGTELGRVTPGEIV